MSVIPDFLTELTTHRGGVLLEGADAHLTADDRLDALDCRGEPGHGRHARPAPADPRGPDLVAVEPHRRRGRRDRAEGRVHDQVYLTVQDAGDHGGLADPKFVGRPGAVALLADDLGTNAVPAQYLSRPGCRPD